MEGRKGNGSSQTKVSRSNNGKDVQVSIETEEKLWEDKTMGKTIQNIGGRILVMNADNFSYPSDDEEDDDDIDADEHWY